MNQQNDYGLEFVNPVSDHQIQGSPPPPFMDLMRNNDMLKVIKEYLEDDSIPKDKSKKFWGIHTKFVPISFFLKEDLEEIGLSAENMELIEIMSKPPEDFTWEEMQDNEQRRFFLKTQVRRSIGSPKIIHNERTMQNTQIGQMISTPSSMPGQGGIRGFVNKIFG